VPPGSLQQNDGRPRTSPTRRGSALRLVLPPTVTRPSAGSTRRPGRDRSTAGGPVMSMRATCSSVRRA
jgi:hypothetical protein